MKKIRVMIVEDSPVVQQFLEHIINQDPRLEVVAVASTAEKALGLMSQVSPAVISMDIRLPGMNGLKATQHIMREQPTPIVVVAGSVTSEDLQISMSALCYGALAVVEKPVGTTHQDYQALATQLCTQLAIMSQVKVVRQRWSRDSGEPPSKANGIQMANPALQDSNSYEQLGIVASTGGPSAVLKLLGDLGPHFPLPIALVQHMSEGFLSGFASWLDGACPFRVTIAEEGERPAQGTVYLAPANQHLCLERGSWRFDAGDPVSSQRPSGTVLLRSMAKNLGSRALGVLLTGMGDDGAAGLKALHDAGGYTIAEDVSTAVVYGMPGAAVRIGAVRESLPLHRIGNRLKQLVAAQQELSHAK